MKIGIIQLNSRYEPQTNLEKIKNFIKEAKRQNADAVFLPETFYSMHNGINHFPYPLKENCDDFKFIANLAKENEIYILGGSAAMPSPVNSSKLVNRSLNFNSKGELIATYDKINLFSCNIKNNNHDERIHYDAGTKLQTFDIEEFGAKIGLSICFDLRFSSLYRKYYEMNVNLISISSAFTKVTGAAHWHTLVRARAIESQAFVVAVNQWGKHGDINNPKAPETFGHSLVVNPWGELLYDAKEGESVHVVDINFQEIESVRTRISMN